MTITPEQLAEWRRLADVPDWSVFEGLAQIVDGDGELIADFGVASIYSEETCHANARLVIDVLRDIPALVAALREAWASQAEHRERFKAMEQAFIAASYAQEKAERQRDEARALLGEAQPFVEAGIHAAEIGEFWNVNSGGTEEHAENCRTNAERCRNLLARIDSALKGRWLMSTEEEALARELSKTLGLFDEDGKRVAGFVLDREANLRRKLLAQACRDESGMNEALDRVTEVTAQRDSAIAEVDRMFKRVEEMKTRMEEAVRHSIAHNQEAMKFKDERDSLKARLEEMVREVRQFALGLTSHAAKGSSLWRISCDLEAIADRAKETP